jgi:large subunit ribosomal protein L28
MPAKCYYTGKRTTRGNNVARSGAAIKKGGFGLHISGKTRRTFKPNLQSMHIIDENGVARRAKVSTKAIKLGLVNKPLKRKYGYTREQKQAGNA